MARGMIDRMKGAAMLDVDTFEEVEHDQTATGQAALVVALGAVAAGIGTSSLGVIGSATAAVWALVSWGLWAGLTYLIGSRLFDGTADWGELLRTLGFASAPKVLLVAGIIPFFPETLLSLVVWLWVLAAGVIAVRQALDFSTGKALATVGLGWGVVFLGSLFVGTFVAIVGGIAAS